MPERVKCIPRWKVDLLPRTHYNDREELSCDPYNSFAGLRYLTAAYIYDVDGFSAWCKVQGTYPTDQADGLIMPEWAIAARARGRLNYSGASPAKPWGRQRRWRRV